MAQASGSRGRILFLPESTWGTKPSVTPGDSFLVHFESESLDCSQQRMQNPHITSSRNPGPGSLDKVECGGGINIKLNPLSHGIVWQALFGAPVTTGAGPYVHTFKVGSTLPSYTVEKGYTDNDDYFWLNGMTLGSLQLSIAASGYVDTSTTWMGKGEDASSPAVASFDSAPTNNGDAPFELTNANMAITEGGSPIATVTKVDLTIDNQVDGATYLVAAQGYRGGVTPGIVKVSGTLTAMFDSTTLYAKATGSTESSLSITLALGTGAGTAGNEYTTITIDELLYGRSIPKISGPAGVLVELPFEAYYTDGASASTVKVVVGNAIASY